MWFEKLTGFKEESPDQVRSLLELEGHHIRSKVNGKSYQCGELQIASLEHLRSLTDPIPYSGKLKLRQVVGDVKNLHNDPTNKHALFQAASQFNLLEMINPEITPEMGIDRYSFDHTQGPACAIACGAGTIFRNYFVQINNQIGQSAKTQVDCLNGIGQELNNEELQLWRMKNGYALVTQQGLLKINEILGSMSIEEKETLKSKLELGIQWNTEVTIANPEQIVSQIYCSALPVSYTRIESFYWQSFASLILEASYEATFRAGILNAKRFGSNKLFLTLVGGGAFGNEMFWIMDALKTNLEKFKNSGLDVNIVSYGQPDANVQELIDNF